MLQQAVGVRMSTALAHSEAYYVKKSHQMKFAYWLLQNKSIVKKKIWLLKVHWATMVVFTPGIFAADRIRVRLCECTPRSIDWLAWFCRTMVHLRSSYVITNMHGERSVTHHIFFFYYYFGAITSSRYYAQQRTFPCHSWYTCVVETHDTVIG